MSQVLNTLDLITQFLLVAFRGILSHPPFLGTRIPSPNPLRTSPPPSFGGKYTSNSVDTTDRRCLSQLVPGIRG